jgi:hypothetical protein
MKNKLLLVLPSLSLSALMLLPLQASETSLTEALAQCQQEQDTLLRLRCYDAIEVELRKSQAQPAPAATKPQRQPEPKATRQQSQAEPEPAASEPPAAAEDRFGKPKQQAADEPDRIYSVVSNVEQDIHGHLIITFENGQTWRQVSSGYYPINPGEEHYIRRAMLGSFLLSSDSSNRTTRVRRTD